MKNLQLLKSGIACLLFSGIAICIIAACDNTKTTNTQDASNKEEKEEKNNSEFAVKAAEGGIYEVEMGKLAEMKGNTEPVKELGRMMASDHSKANEELKTLAAGKNIMLPTAMGDKNQKNYDLLAGKSGEEFDQKYAEMMVDDHEKDIKLFKDQAEDGADTDLKNWAAGKIPVLEHHLQMAKSVSESVKNSK